MAFINCPECGRKVNVHADTCGRAMTDPITRLKAELARIEAAWEQEQRTLHATIRTGSVSRTSVMPWRPSPWRLSSVCSAQDAAPPP